MDTDVDASDAVQALEELVAESHNADPADQRIRASALVARLKSAHRIANAVSQQRRAETSTTRAEMDAAHLRLQNLLYEKRHLEREIDKCRQFASIYQDVPIYSVDEFRQLAPPEAHSEDPHQQMLNRLSFELVERQRLELRRVNLEKQKEKLLADSKTKADRMKDVKQEIENTAKVAHAAQTKVAMHVSSVLGPDIVMV
ncbi:Fms-interacting protein-domain-containing protein [Schizophyllum amplum]|uniref:Fms-interacting protein-domain-containing protein n=1 Tax=Schizophyllum amplum TaxID=97359 RepID=A0A550CRX2_9AGAR|nr:Fms-interacting protein-domain-containing protein [Auriculariopsis ampla]